MLLTNIKQLVGVLPKGIKKLEGAHMNNLEIIENAFLSIKEGKIHDFGPMSSAPKSSDQVIDCADKVVLPTFCDSHTHLVFAKTREKEFVMRIKGKSYEEIAKAGGGILNSAKVLQETPEDALFESAQKRLHEVINMGTGAIEIKSGYGLTLDAELKMLRVIKRLKESSSIPIKATFLGAHALPFTYKNNRAAYIDLIIDEMLPKIKAQNLADYIDVFCDQGFFTPQETEKLLLAGEKSGLKGKIHANELGFSGGIEVAAKLNALSADHLECTGPSQIEALKNSQTMPTLLPSTAFFLGLHYPPARTMIDAGLPIALASDYNPGSSPSGNMCFINSLACTKMNMTPTESINASTMNSAYAMQLEDQLGSITKGKLANLIITEQIGGFENLSYGFGRPQIEQVLIKGKPFIL